MWTEEMENQIRIRLTEKLQSLGDDVRNRYERIAVNVAAISRDLIDGLIIGAEIDEEVTILEATILQLASAGEALAVREVKATIKEVAGIVFEFMVRAALSALKEK